MKPKIVFYQQFSVPYFGVLSLISHLGAQGIDADVVVSSLEQDPVAAIARVRPDVIGISVMSVEHRWLARSVKALRDALPGAVIVVGGVHAVLYPEEVMALPEVDLVCTSDGEVVMLDIVRELEGGRPAWHRVKGIGYRNGTGTVRINERAALFPYRDDVIEDRSVYFRRYPSLARDTAQRFISSRGCPYTCSFCYNETLRTIFKDAGAYVRRKGPMSLLREIRQVCDGARVESVFFMDDLFTMDKAWLRDFLARYKREVGIPFVCTTRANIMDEERAALLSDAGCRTVSYGVESGNYEIRKAVLGKDISDEAIIACGRLLKEHGLMAQTTNMFCLPGETLRDAFQTVELNIRARTDYAFASLLMPFPKTAIAEYCMRRGYIKPNYSFNDLPESFMTHSILTLEEKDVIINVQRLSYFFIRYPWLFRTFKGVARLAVLQKLFNLIFELGNFLRHKGERGITFLAAFRYAWRMRKYF